LKPHRYILDKQIVFSQNKRTIMLKAKRYHIVCDLMKCNNKINKKNELIDFIVNLAQLINMKIIKGPEIEKGTAKNPGLTAFAIIDYSHISVHTFTKYNEALIDIFSCKKYNAKKAFDFCLNFFESDINNSRINKVCWE